MMGVELDGGESLKELISKMLEAGSAIKSADLRSIPRNDTSTENSEILDELKKQNRNFRDTNNKQKEEIAQSFADEIEKAYSQNPDANASAVAAKAFLAAMAKYCEIVISNIEEQRIQNKSLTPAYEAQKIKRFGFAKPIGKASGRLIDNLNPSDVAKHTDLKKR